MRVRDIILFGLLMAVGAFCFHRGHERDRRHVAALRAREAEVARDVARLRGRHHALRAEAHALRTDPYYVERTLREQYGWRPPRRLVEAVPPVDVPPLVDPGDALADAGVDLPLMVPREPEPPQPVQQQDPPPVQPSPPEPPQPRVDADRELLERLGYTSVAHFQRKMLPDHRTGELDEASRLRVRTLAALLQRAGYASVRDFQRANGLTVDGVYGQRTERAVIAELRRGRSIVVEDGRSNEGGG